MGELNPFMNGRPRTTLIPECSFSMSGDHGNAFSGFRLQTAGSKPTIFVHWESEAPSTWFLWYVGRIQAWHFLLFNPKCNSLLEYPVTTLFWFNHWFQSFDSVSPFYPLGPSFWSWIFWLQSSDFSLSISILWFPTGHNIVVVGIISVVDSWCGEVVGVFRFQILISFVAQQIWSPFFHKVLPIPLHWFILVDCAPLLLFDLFWWHWLGCCPALSGWTLNISWSVQLSAATHFVFRRLATVFVSIVYFGHIDWDVFWKDPVGHPLFVVTLTGMSSRIIRLDISPRFWGHIDQDVCSDSTEIPNLLHLCCTQEKGWVLLSIPFLCSPTIIATMLLLNPRTQACYWWYHSHKLESDHQSLVSILFQSSWIHQVHMGRCLTWCTALGVYNTFDGIL